jgi:predicted RNA binding protein YcfA (HicA-like mRNA interferase family)
MPPLKPTSPDAVQRAFERDGWSVSRRVGSHVILTKAGERANLSIPFHAGEDVALGTLRQLIRRAGLTVERFLELLEG